MLELLRSSALVNVEAITTAIVLGILISAWAAHFSGPLPAQEIRVAVPRPRYYAALSVHIFGILSIYGILVLIIYAVVVLLIDDRARSCWAARLFTWAQLTCDSGQTGRPPGPSFQPQVLVWAALVSALIVRMVMPIVPITRRIMDRFLFLTQELALFPFARQMLVSTLAASNFTIAKAADGELSHELGRYGIDSKWISFLSQSTKKSMLEVFSIRLRLLEVLDRSESHRRSLWNRASELKRTLLALVSLSADETEFAEAGALQRFKQARAPVLNEVETDFRRLVRRTALALLLVEQISEKFEDEALSRSISNFVAEECDHLLARYRILVAEAALSCVSHREERAQFLRTFGYDTNVPPSLPLTPWLIVFALDFLLFLVPSVISHFSGQNIGINRFVAFACVHAIAQSIAITWAIYPKVVSNFARPSLYSYPVRSYVWFGLLSYLTGATILFIFRVYIQLPFPIVVPTLISSISFLLMTVGVSVLIDARLKSRSLDFEHGRVREGLLMAALMAAGTINFQIWVIAIPSFLGWVARPRWYIPVIFLILSTSLGYVVGYLVPSATAAYLQKSRLWTDRVDGSRLPPQRSELATAPAASAPHA
jgi:hypothetical protein